MSNCTADAMARIAYTSINFSKIMLMLNTIRLFLLPLLAITLLAQADSHPTYTSYAERPEVQTFAADMTKKHGGTTAEWLALLSKAHFQPKVVTLVMPSEPTGKKNWLSYSQRFINSHRIDAGVAFWAQHASALQRAEQLYGIPAEIIVSIIGVETLYGKKMGEFNVLNALTTLAFDYPNTPNRNIRTELFKKELEHFLVWSKSNHLPITKIKGSYTGAIGIPQFLPSSINQYAVNFDNGEKIDLRNSPIDAIGSIANFLKLHGWESHRPVIWKIADTTTSLAAAKNFADGLPKPRFPLQQLLDAKLVVDETIDLSKEKNTLVLVADFPIPEQTTQYLLGLQNFYALTRYNQSFFYARAVYELAQAIRAEKYK
jgi:membrane-bound lytic murein transglycosylase B